MSSKKALIEKRLSLINQQKDLHKRANEDGRVLAADERTQWDAIEADLVTIRQQITDFDTIARNAAELDSYTEQRTTIVSGADGGNTPPKADDKAQRYAQAFEQVARRGMGSLTPEQRSLVAEFRGTNPQSAGTDSLGGYLVPETWSDRLIESMQAYGTLLDVATVDRPTSGGTVRYPTHDGTAETGRWVAENAARAIKDTSFGEVTLGDHEVTSDIVLISAALAQDNAYDLQGRLSGMLGRRIGVTMGEAMTTGDGSGKPRGVVLDATAGVTAAAVDALTVAELIALEHSLDPAYRAGTNVRWMFHDQTLAAIKKLTFGSSDARPLWMPSMRDGEPDTILGYAYVINQAMAQLGADNVPVLFGDFANYQVKMARDISMFVFRENYMVNNQIGYMANARVDGRLLDPKSVKKLTNAAA